VCILGIIGLAQDRQARFDSKEDTSVVDASIVACGLGFAACCLGLMLTMATLFRNRRGEHVLAEAKRAAGKLIPCNRRDCFDLAPQDLTRAIGLFGLTPWAVRSPLCELQAAFYPPTESSGGG
jgi:hypothetical protein